MSTQKQQSLHDSMPHIVAVVILGVMLALVGALAMSGGNLVVHRSMAAICPPGQYSSANYGCLQPKAFTSDVEEPLISDIPAKGASPTYPLPPAPSINIDLTKIVTTVDKVEVVKHTAGQTGDDGYTVFMVPANQYAAALTKINILDPEMYSYIKLTTISSKSILSERVPLPEGYNSSYETILEPSITK